MGKERPEISGRQTKDPKKIMLTTWARRSLRETITNDTKTNEGRRMDQNEIGRHSKSSEQRLQITRVRDSFPF